MYSTAINVYQAFRSREASGDFAAWAERYPELHRLLIWAQKEAMKNG